MARKRRPSLRGSVTQRTSMVRVRETSRFSVMTRLAMLSAIILFGLVFGLWGWKSGWFHRESAQLTDTGLTLTQKAHFAVNDIIVEGRKFTDKDQLTAALGTTRDAPIFSFSPAEAEARISKLAWVKTAIVERRLPNTIYIHLIERVPLARWQHDNQISVIDNDGKVLVDASPGKFADLPLVVGNGAPNEAKNLLDILHTFPPVEHAMTAAVRVSERRWDIHLQPKIVARLPDREVSDALKRLSILITEQKILERDIVTIDLRIPDRLIIESATPKADQPQVGGDQH